jgi:hypothetical protein
MESTTFCDGKIPTKPNNSDIGLDDVMDAAPPTLMEEAGFALMVTDSVTPLGGESCTEIVPDSGNPT